MRPRPVPPARSRTGRRSPSCRGPGRRRRWRRSSATCRRRARTSPPPAGGTTAHRADARQELGNPRRCPPDLQQQRRGAGARAARRTVPVTALPRLTSSGWPLPRRRAAAGSSAAAPAPGRDGTGRCPRPAATGAASGAGRCAPLPSTRCRRAAGIGVPGPPALGRSMGHHPSLERPGQIGGRRPASGRASRSAGPPSSSAADEPVDRGRGAARDHPVGVVPPRPCGAKFGT